MEAVMSSVRKLKKEYPGGLQVCDDPQVFIFDEFMSAEECAHLIELASPHLTPSLVSGGKDGVRSDGRTGGVHWIPHGKTESARKLSERVAELVDIPLVNCESIQVIYYAEGQEYRPHYDAWEHDSETGKRCLSRGGQRMVTCLGYLNRVQAGGGTFFPKLDIEIMPRLGRIVLFHNCYPDSTKRHDKSLHGGMPLDKGEKWACNFWFRENRFQTEPKQDPFRPSETTRRF
jgi:prolyl 4-hydroxylase